MKKLPLVSRLVAAVLAALVLAVLGLVGPAQADTGWHGTSAPLKSPVHSVVKPMDTGWNGT